MKTQKNNNELSKHNAVDESEQMKKGKKIWDEKAYISLISFAQAYKGLKTIEKENIN